MERSFEKKYRLVLFFLKLSGFLRLESRSKLVNCLIPFCSVTAFLLFLLPAFYGFVHFSEYIDASRRFNIIALAEETIFIWMKTIVLISVREKMSKLIKICKNLWESVENENDIAIVEPYLKQGRYFIYCFTIQISTAIVVNMFYAIFSEVKREIDGKVVLMRWLSTPNSLLVEGRLTYYICFVVQAPMVAFITCISITVDAVIPALILSASGHMKLVESWLNNMNNRRESNTNPDEYDNRRELVKCIQHHQKVYTYYETLESTLNLVMLLQICLGMSVTAVIGVNILMERSTIYSRVPLMSGAILRLAVQCWPPDQVNSAGVAVARAIYALPWTSWSIRDRRMLLTMLMRAQKPVQLTAGKFAAMSLETFSAIMSRAMSFYAVLRAFM